MDKTYNDTYGGRLKWAREQKGLSQSELARRIGGMKAQNVQYLENADKAAKGSSHTYAFARELAVNPEWLASGRGDPFNELRELLTQYGTPRPVQGEVPLLTWVRAGELCGSERSFTKDDAERWLPCPVAYKMEIFALTVSGSSMDDGTSNGYPDGITIFVDPTIQATHMNDVIVYTPDGRTTFKRLEVTPDGKKLVALNPDWPERILPVPEGTRICGVVVFSGQIRR